MQTSAPNWGFAAFCLPHISRFERVFAVNRWYVKSSVDLCFESNGPSATSGYRFLIRRLSLAGQAASRKKDLSKVNNWLAMTAGRRNFLASLRLRSIAKPTPGLFLRQMCDQPCSRFEYRSQQLSSECLSIYNFRM